MDDFIGTQSPAHRITEPAEAVRVLERAVPDLGAYRRAEAAVIDWAVLEGENGLGTALPGDFKLLAELYPAFALGDFLLVGLPGPGAEHDLLRGIRRDLAGRIQDWVDSDMTVGLALHPAPGGLLPWGDSNEGDVFLWRTTGAGPDDWEVTVASRNGGWWHYAGGLVQFLAELADGTLERWALPTVDKDVAVFPD